VRVSDSVLGLLAMVFGAALLWHIRSFPEIPGHFYGPGFFPGIVGWGFILFGALLLVRVGRQSRWREKLVSFPAWRSNGRGTVAAIGVLVAIQAFSYFGDGIGFQLLSTLVMAALFLWAGRGWVFSLSLAVAITVVLDALFSKLLSVPLPTGLLSNYWW
jgi:putative tricarboxylic transport membrane protein